MEEHGSSGRPSLTLLARAANSVVANLLTSAHGRVVSAPCNRGIPAVRLSVYLGGQSKKLHSVDELKSGDPVGWYPWTSYNEISDWKREVHIEGSLVMSICPSASIVIPKQVLRSRTVTLDNFLQHQAMSLMHETPAVSGSLFPSQSPVIHTSCLRAFCSTDQHWKSSF